MDSPNLTQLPFMRTATQPLSLLLLLRALLQQCHQQLFLVPHALPPHSSTTLPIPCFFSLCIHLPTFILSACPWNPHSYLKWRGKEITQCVRIIYYTPMPFYSNTLYFILQSIFKVPRRDHSSFNFFQLVAVSFGKLHPASPVSDYFKANMEGLKWFAAHPRAWSIYTMSYVLCYIWLTL